MDQGINELMRVPQRLGASERFSPLHKELLIIIFIVPFTLVNSRDEVGKLLGSWAFIIANWMKQLGQGQVLAAFS